MRSSNNNHSNSTPLAILPRINNGYSRRDSNDYGNKGPDGGRRRFKWKLLGLGGTLLFLFVWILGPRERRQKVWDTVGIYPHEKGGEGYQITTLPPQPTTISAATRLTFETDPNPSSTTHCTKPYKPSVPLVQWALMIDAGSTGSRIHIYKFHNCGPSPEYEYEVFEKIKGGLSSYASNPEGAAQSLDGLMDKALEVVPEEFRKCTPVAVKATAGLRLLGLEDSENILDAVRHRLETEYPFPIAGKDGVVIMDGKDEGVYAWITANYLLDTIRSNKNADSTYAVLDLGGASTQIVFEPTITRSDTKFEDGDHKYRLHFGGREHVLYQNSYLGYGLMQARNSVHRLVDFMHLPGKKNLDIEIANPCLSQGTRRSVIIEDPPSECAPGESPERNITMIGADVGDFESCNRVVELVMAKHALCHVKPCSFNGVYQPSILDTFPNGQILLLSYFYDRLEPLLPPSTTTIHIDYLKTLAQQICAGPSSWLKHWGSNPTAMAELQDRPEYCLDMTFMHALLRLGYEFKAERVVYIAKQIEDTELGWCLGATIAVLEGGVTCEI
ncbi:hypothetical protein M422DRAFT_261035 [Sphaerobolus stellatus SS14]|uniref:guanosine-diphosphatase n=1 Tax=Sphaerobolus stellatus (strain SS14) TaxID=990650 RepID=A0A0C9V4P0_SPHS4|nr:hypothetical protein M422DRAFT_261035 [Sphaerobolus stellatus SS14]